MGINYTKLSKVMSLVLRHEPWLFELELDDEGWVTVADMLAALRAERPEWGTLTVSQLAHMISISDKQRYEIDEVAGRIRALYGHSIPGKLSKTPGEPPEVLYHGTSPAAVPAIKESGLSAMGRQYVHLSVDVPTAQAVGKRKAKSPTILRVLARQASQQGVVFYIGNDKVWLADAVPPEYIVLEGA